MSLVFPCGSAGKESTCNVGDLGSIPGLGRSPGEGKGYTLQYSGLENSMDSPWGQKESNMTERLSLHFTLGSGICSLPLLPTFTCKQMFVEVVLWGGFWLLKNRGVYFLFHLQSITWCFFIQCRYKKWFKYPFDLSLTHTLTCTYTHFLTGNKFK